MPGPGLRGFAPSFGGFWTPDLYASIDLLQEKWNLHIIRALLDGAMGFNDGA